MNKELQQTLTDAIEAHIARLRLAKLEIEKNNRSPMDTAQYLSRNSGVMMRQYHGISDMMRRGLEQ